MFYNNENVVAISLTVLECLRFICFFLVCYFFCKRASHILPNNKCWLLLLRIFLLVDIAYMLTALVILDMKIMRGGSNPNDLCITPTFIVLRTSGEIITVIFFIIGIAITVNVKKISRQTIYEKTYIRFQQ